VDLFPIGFGGEDLDMSTSSIRALKPNVNREEALRTFSAPGLSTFYWRVRSGPLQRMADVYVPFSLYTTRYEMAQSTVRRVFALDAVDGSLDLFQFSHIPEPEQFVTVATRNFLPPSLCEARASDLLREKVLRLIFQQGFFKLREPKLEITREPSELHVPYWLGFYGNVILKCRVLDAVRRRFEGAKASAFFEAWLAA
jgi:hypothetical protein